MGHAVVSYATSEGASARGQEASSGAASSSEANASFDIVAASAWPGVPAERVLLAPAQCRTLWRQFASDSAYAVQQVRGPGAPACLPQGGHAASKRLLVPLQAAGVQHVKPFQAA